MSNSAPKEMQGGFQPWHLINFFFGLMWPGMFFVLVQTYVLEVTGSAADAGLVMGIIGLGALATPVFGGLADRYRAHRPAQVLAFSMIIAGILLMGFAQDRMFFVLAAILIGFGLAPGSMISNVYAVASGLSQEAEARTVASLKRMTFMGQILGGLAIAGLLFVDLPFQVLFLISAGVAAACLFLAWFTTRSVAAQVAELAGQRVEKAHKAAAPGKFSLGDILKSTFGLVLLAVFLNQQGWSGLFSQFINFFSGAFGITPSITSVVNSVAILINLFIIGWVGAWMGKAGPVPVASAGIGLRAALALALAAVGWAFGGTSGAIAMVLPLLVWVALRQLIPLVGMSAPVLAARTAPGGAAQAQALLIAVFALSSAFGSLLSGQLAENVGWLALPRQTVVFCALAFLVVRFGIAPRLGEGSNEPEPEMLLMATEMEE